MNRVEKPKLSLVMPAYNEEDHVKEVIEKMDFFVRTMGVNYEVIVVDDGSRDETGIKAMEYANENGHVKVVSYPKNMGKGYAIKTGFFSAEGESVVFMDSDLEIDPTQIRKYVRALESGDLVIASKRHPQSCVEIPFLRRFLSSGFNVLVRLLTGLGVRDTQSGLKAVRRKSLKKVFSVLSVKRFAFDVELLAVANLYGLKIVEMPVNIRLANSLFDPKEVFRMFIDLLGITYRLRIKKHYLNSTKNLHNENLSAT